MRTPSLAPFLAVIVVAGFALFLGDITGSIFADPGPFFRVPAPEVWAAPDGSTISNPSEAVTFLQDTLFFIRAFDANTTQELRSALLAKTLNRIVAGTPPGVPVPGLRAAACPDAPGALGIYLETPVEGDSLLIRLTYDDVQKERSRGDTSVNIVSLAERWRSALAAALRQSPENPLFEAVPPGSAPTMSSPMESLP